MSATVSLRNIPPEAKHLAATLSEQMSLTIADVYRKAIVVGLLVEATTIPPAQDGTLAGLELATLAKALRRYLSPAIDLLLEQHELPYHVTTSNTAGSEQDVRPVPQPAPQQPARSEPVGFVGAMAEDLELLGFGRGLSQTMAREQEC